MSKYIPQELFEHYNVYMFDINRTNDVCDLILKMWDENKMLYDNLKYSDHVIGKRNNKINELQKRIDAAVDEIKYFELQADHLDDNIYLYKTLSNKLLEILKGNEK